MHVTHSPGKKYEDTADLGRDIKYSEEMWIHQGKTFLCNLNMKDKNRLIGKEDDGWLNDIIIDASMQLLEHQFPDISCTQ